VAHEIKNPLTPMRLSVQQLQRAWSDKDENFEEYLCRMSQTLIEQIDTLSTIATEFSNFAKIPTAQISEIDLADTLNKVVELFESDSSYEIKYDHIKEKLLVQADGEQLKRVFINIIKNAIQAIPPNRSGEIKVDLIQKTNTYEVCVSDNGKGIPEDIHDKLFQPNFTTKSSGMGLGLSIVKKILDQFDAQIRFETKPGIGTTFYIELKKE
ncbi:MAG: ATP-binding protein, partial [Bacteroidales bacterium]|nr:ATP-binding protein [Bacteroidales bacterium]